jgi:hypothetical protein
MRSCVCSALSLSLALIVTSMSQAGADHLVGILKTWREKQAQVHSIKCEATVESFYAKAGFNSLFPEADSTYHSQFCSWTIDFENAKIRKEAKLIKPYFRFGQKLGAFEPEYSIRLSVNNRNRVFRPKNENEWAKTREGAKMWDLLEDTGSHDILSFGDIPLLWVAGAVTGQIPAPNMLRHLDDLAKWSYRGQGEKGGNRCFVLTTPEQNATTLVREFWVGITPPHLILFCCAREDDVIFWQHEVTYSMRNNWVVPERMNVTEFVGRSARIRMNQLFSFKEFEINPAINVQVFHRDPAPGMLVRYNRKPGYFVVDEGGDLVPEMARKGSRRYLLGALAVLLLLLLAIGWYWRNRRQCGAGDGKS